MGLKKLLSDNIISTSLIVLSLFGLIVLLYPIISVYLFPKAVISEVPKNGTYITIPKIAAQSPVVESVDPWDESEYMEALKKGVAQAQGTSLPGEKGTSFLFAHSSGNPLEMNQYNTVFFRLSELVKGDDIIILRNGERTRYIVREKKVILPTETDYLKQNPKDQLILQTCTPIGTNLKRLLVFADPVS
jgi:sortase A